MSTPIDANDYLKALLDMLDETFTTHHGIFLDKGTSLLSTLDTISAEQASIPVGGRCASLAAQVAHVIFYIESFERYAIHQDTTPVDWGEIWRTVEKVTPEEWQAMKDDLNLAYHRMRTLFAENPTWNEDTIGGTMAIVVHTAYHLGEIRQALCTLR
jgi:hypothetical protein